MVFWARCGEVVHLSDADLDAWSKRGVGGFVCKHDYLAGLGGSQQFTGDPAASLSGTTYNLQRAIRDTGIVKRAAARGITLWLGIGAGNYWNDKTPWAEWFDDAGWSTQVLPNMTRLASAARMLGFAGLAFDEELYPAQSGKTGTWLWNYPGNTRSAAAVREQVRVRGAQMMEAMVAGFPKVEVINIGWRFPESWEELVQKEINGITNANANWVTINFWDGMTSTTGYGAVRFMDSAFNKTSHLNRSTWDTSLAYDTNRLFAMFSRTFRNWSYAASRVQVAPFVWINSGVTPFEAARPPDYVAAQLAKFRHWSTGGVFANYVYGSLSTFDYTPYVPGLQSGATPGVVDSQSPSLSVGSPTRAGADVLIGGSAQDNMAIRTVEWRTASGKTGAATMTWTVVGGDWQVGYQWRMDWNARIPAASGERIIVTAWDSKGWPVSKPVVAP